MEELDFTITSAIYLYQGKGAWYFIRVEGEKAEQIKFFTDPKNTGRKRRGWGSVKVKATVGETTWETSIFPSKERGDYVLPVKAAVRKAEKLLDGNQVTVRLVIKTGL
ncbi:MAG: DUF1905 domain-containing protein [Emcibacteraceae bacterium]|nr:DUF1905 domain-containing protein [Emcibacteraceae bacterium]MDG1859456.1 DUF1905 domain-containing protein [Emcibacteraceae bacterium]